MTVILVSAFNMHSPGFRVLLRTPRWPVRILVIFHRSSPSLYVLIIAHEPFEYYLAILNV